MRTYKFTTKISDNGTIKIPYNPDLFDKEVEIVIVTKSSNKSKHPKATEFVNKWAGFLTNTNTDKSKYDYLSDKYK